jgi:hypothetical protein
MLLVCFSPLSKAIEHELLSSVGKVAVQLFGDQLHDQ